MFEKNPFTMYKKAKITLLKVFQYCLQEEIKVKVKKSLKLYLNGCLCGVFNV